jgi:hypothetical protein
MEKAESQIKLSEGELRSKVLVAGYNNYIAEIEKKYKEGKISEVDFFCRKGSTIAHVYNGLKKFDKDKAVLFAQSVASDILDLMCSKISLKPSRTKWRHSLRLAAKEADLRSVVKNNDPVQKVKVKQ